jgi:hypothetical protein
MSSLPLLLNIFVTVHSCRFTVHGFSNELCKDKNILLSHRSYFLRERHLLNAVKKLQKRINISYLTTNIYNLKSQFQNVQFRSLRLSVRDQGRRKF